MPQLTDVNPEQVIKLIKDRPTVLSLLIEVEDFFDSLDMYVFKNWFKGSIVAGPKITRHWISVTLKWEYYDLPDPKGVERLNLYDCRVSYEKSEALYPREVITQDDIADYGTQAQKLERRPIWLFYIHIPRRFIDDIDDEELEELSDEQEVDIEDVDQGTDEGLSDDETVQDDTGEGGGDLDDILGDLEEL